MRPERPLWRRAPPAIFPVCLGFLGLGLGWRSAAETLPIPHEIGDLLLGVASAYFIYFQAIYLRKFIQNPTVIWHDMDTPAGRAGIAASAMAMMLLAAALLPFGLSVALVWWTGVLMQIVASGLGCLAILRDPAHERSFSPFQFLTFVGPVVGPIAGIPLGYVWQSYALTFGALLAYAVITLGYGRRLLRARPEVGLRPKLMIFLAPNCLFAISFGLLGVDWAFWLFFWMATVVAALLLPIVPWMMKGGWAPSWGAFTFPFAVLLNLQAMALARGAGPLLHVGVYLCLLVATPLILWIVYRSFLAWVTGELGTVSGAARV